MAIPKVAVYGDKTIAVPPGQVVRTGYVPIDDIVLGCKERMSIGDVLDKYELVKQNAPNAIFPAPMGGWVMDGRFVVEDGRHLIEGYRLNGYTHVLVMWLEEG
jgi:hypothetical protein